VEQLGDAKSRLELIDTIAHEGRHAYQHYAIEHPGFHPNTHEVDAWRENFKNYRDGKKIWIPRLPPSTNRSRRLEFRAFSFADMDATNRNSMTA